MCLVSEGRAVRKKQWLDDITDWAKMELPEVVTLAKDRQAYRQLVHRIVQAPYGV